MYGNKTTLTLPEPDI
jgi:hypothetical protein